MLCRPRGRTLRSTPRGRRSVTSKILVAYDGSESARRALAETARLANGNSVTVVSVAEPLPQFGRAGELLLPEEDAERRRELLDAKQLLAERGIEAAVVERKATPRRASSTRQSGSTPTSSCSARGGSARAGAG
jgi:nucleotide-binding universal stress UspA family protein